MSRKIPDFSDVSAAARRIQGHAVRTPLVRDSQLEKIAGCEVLIKNETMQKTGSFKYRGGYARLSALSKRDKKYGIVAFSSGNHAQGVALAARELGVSATIVMPTTAPEKKKRGTLSHGAKVIEYTPATESREAIADRIAREEGRIIVPSFDDPYIISGQGTVGLEVAGQCQEMGIRPTKIIIPLGGGGLCAGISLAMNRLSPATEIFGAEPVGYDDHYRSLLAGRRIAYPVSAPGTACDALKTPKPGKLTFAINRKALSGVCRVPDEACFLTMALIKSRLGIVAEPGGSIALASVLSRELHTDKTDTVIAIVSGGIVDDDVFENALEYAVSLENEWWRSDSSARLPGDHA